MRKFKFEENGHVFEFVCTSRNTRNGFAHDARLFIDDRNDQADKATCNYLNRTWERYAYQTVMLSLVRSRIARHVERARGEFMRSRNYERMTAKRKNEFRDWIDNECDDQSLFTWCKLYAAVYNHDLMDPPYPDWYGHRPAYYPPSHFAW